MKAQLKADRRMRDGEVGIHCAMDDGDDEIAKVLKCAGGARCGPVSDLLISSDNVPAATDVLLPRGKSVIGVADPDPSRRRSKINKVYLSSSRHDRSGDD